MTMRQESSAPQSRLPGNHMKLNAILAASLSPILVSSQSPDKNATRPVATEKAPTTMVLPSTQPANFTAGSIFFIGNATVLIRYAGFTILTDPTFIHKHDEVP